MQRTSARRLMVAAIEVISVVAVIVVTPSIASPSHLQGICELTAEKETCYLLLSRRRQFTHTDVIPAGLVDRYFDRWLRGNLPLFLQ